MRLLFGVLALLDMLAARPGCAQTAAPAFARYTTEQGLSHNGTTALAKDRRGFLWVGTINGLNRFDGVQFKVYRHTNQANSLPSSYVLRNGLTLDPLGYLWVATTRGLWRFDPVREQGLVLPVPERRDSLAAGPMLSAVRFDQAGQGWFASSNHLYRLDPRTLRLTAFPLPHPIPGDLPEPIVDGAGRVWVYFQMAAYRFEAAARRYTYYVGLDDQHPRGLPLHGLVRGEGPDLYAVSQRGVWRYDSPTDRFALLAAQFDAHAVADIRPAGAPPVVWLGGSDRLIRYEPLTRRSTHFVQAADDPRSYPGNATLALLHDASTSILWVATARGLAALDPQANAFRRQLVFTPDARRYPDDVHLVCQDHTNDSLYWVVTRQAGLWRWQRGHLTPVPLPAAIGSRMRGLQQDTQGRLWLGLSMHRGLARYDPATGQWQRLGQAPTSYAPAEFRQLYFDRRGRLWLATFEDGLYWYDAAADCIRRFLLQPSAAPHYTVWGMQEDARGRLWVRTSQGLYRVGADRRPGQLIAIRTVGTPLKLTDVMQSAFLLDRAGRLWLSGTGFVAQVDTSGRVLRTYTLANGLRADQTFGLAEDQCGHFWLATDEQLHELDPATGRFRYYGPSSGLFTNAIYQTFTINRQGELFLGGEGGFNYFQPTRLPRNAVPPPVALTELRVNNQPRTLTPSQAIELRPGETTLTVGFAALNFSQATKNRYAYRLLGFDPSWITTDARTATYTNLAPGDYQLRIRAANNDGVWNRVGQTLTVRVRPAYYQTWWFKSCLLLAGAALGWGVYRYRQAQRQQLARVRDHIAKDLHDDMGSTLSSIRIFSEVAQGQLAGAHPQTQALLERISQNASTLAEAMQDIIWTIKPHQDGLADVVSRMREFGLRLTEAKGIAFRMSVDEPFPVLRLTLEQRRNLYLVFKESVNNAVKYAACTALTVRLRVYQRQLHLHIADNGQGFDPAATRAGNGLANLQARARDIGGQVQLTSAPGAGTTIVLTAPLA